MIQIHHDIEAASVTSLKTQSPSERRDGDCGFQFIPDTRFGLTLWRVTSYIVWGQSPLPQAPISSQPVVTRQSQKRNKIIAGRNF
jgi:hypothetical protein